MIKELREIFFFFSYSTDSDPKQFVMLSVVCNIFLAIMDIIAVFLIGLVVSSFVTNKDQAQNDHINIFFLSLSNTEDDVFQLITAIAISLFIIRTFLSLIFNRYVFKYYANKTFQASKLISQKSFSRNLTINSELNSHEIIYALTTGIDSMILVGMGSIAIVASELTLITLLLGGLIFWEPVVGIMTLLIFSIASIVNSKKISGKIRRNSVQQTHLQMLFVRGLRDALFLLKELSLAGKTNEFLRKVDTSRKQFLDIGAESSYLPNLSKHFLELTMIATACAILLIQSTISSINTAIATFSVFLAASTRILPSLVRVHNGVYSIKQSYGNSFQARKILGEVVLQSNLDLKQAENLTIKQENQTIIFEQVSFGYASSNNLVLRDISFSINQGEFVAIVGDSGVGKSTLINLLLGYLKPTSGKIAIHGMEPEKYVLSNPGHIGYVPQEVYLMEGNIKDNIVLSDNTESKENYISEESLRHLHFGGSLNFKEDVLAFETGEGGEKLSGGERQRIGIARALNSDPVILVLDESTSALDAISEQQIINLLRADGKKRTIIVIAHRLTSIYQAEKIVYLNHGGIVVSGTLEDVKKQVPKFEEQILIFSQTENRKSFPPHKDIVEKKAQIND